MEYRGIKGASPDYGVLSRPNSFTYQYHLDTINQGKALLNKDGTVTTVRVIGVPYEGRIYNVPSYDRDSGKILSDDEALEKWLPFIKAGIVDSWPEKWSGNIKKHPANIAAQEEHRLIERDEERSRQAIKWKP